MWKHSLAMLLAVLLLAGCNSDKKTQEVSSDNIDNKPPIEQELPLDEDNPEEERDEPVIGMPLTRFSLANKCIAMRPVVAEKWLARSEEGIYQAVASAPSAGNSFYFKPSTLGEYMLYADNQTLLRVKPADPTGISGGLFGFRLESLEAPADKPSWGVNSGVLWQVEEDEKGFYLTSRVHDPKATAQTLAVDGDGNLVITERTFSDNENQRFTLEEATGCAIFPELTTNATGEAYKGQGEEQPVIGFADIHSHFSATDFLGGARVGMPFSQYGVPEALPKGTEEHGHTGFFDLIGNIYGGNPFDFHDPQGWPTFKHWPANDRLTYENTYYVWIERAHKAGLRLVVNNLVQNDVLCHLHHVLKVTNPNDPNLFQKVKNLLGSTQLITKFADSVLNGLVEDVLSGVLNDAFANDCNSMKSALTQADFMYRMQDYIDAQHGGEGKGWFRIVTGPAEARRVINEGKLAMVLGIEVSDVFDCKVTRVSALGLTLIEKPHCTKEEIQTSIDLLYNVGVRQINLMHEFNNALGGNGIFDGGFINVGNFLETGEFFQTEKCPKEEYFYSANVEGMLSLDPFSYLGDNPISDAVKLLVQGILPVYSSNPSHCNKRGMTDLGRFALQQVMARKMMIDVDHMSVKMKSQVIAEAKRQTPMYPLLSTHGGHGGITLRQAEDILLTGGVINPIAISPEGFVHHLEKLKPIWPEGRLLAASFTSDINGMAGQSGPPGTKINYPFTLFEGKEWGDNFAHVAPVTFEQSSSELGGRFFDYNEEGIAHYGLYADWVESVRLLGGAEALDALFRSAEDYIRAWEQVENR